MAKKEEYRDLSQAEVARLAGAIWIYGSVNIEYSKTQKYYRPRIALSMPNPLPFYYQKYTEGRIYEGERDGYWTLLIRKQRLVEKRLREILPFIGGEEGKQIEIALQILETKHSEMSRQKKQEKLEKLYDLWKESQKRLEDWIKEFKLACSKIEVHKIPDRLKGIWNKAYAWEDC